MVHARIVVHHLQSIQVNKYQGLLSHTKQHVNVIIAICNGKLNTITHLDRRRIKSDVALPVNVACVSSNYTEKFKL